ncbi:MAG: hypothetical protein QGF57_03320 [Candidatus Marinimicrobia bacterium]|nr:hypothetical protein [Candidatus Neomarinimicrobiota bacterium]
MYKSLLIIGMFIFFGCVPPTVESPTADQGSFQIYDDLEDCDPCELLLNFASSNYQNRDWRGAVDNYNQLLRCNCGSQDPENTFKYMAYSYQQLNMSDSASYIFNQGLKYTPEDTELLKMAGENSGKLGNVEDQIYYYDKILSIEENNVEVLEMLSNVYRDQEMYENQVDILDIWLKYEPANKTANAEKKAAFSALGKDESDVDRERWESEPSNIQYGLAYIQSLQDLGADEKIIEVSNEILVYEKYNTDILRALGDAYLNLYKEDEALDVYNTLAKADPTNFDVAIDISKILINREKFQDAHKWAEKAVSMSGKKGSAIYQRAEVYYAAAELCSGDPLSFWDKVVYEISWEDYKEAFNKGFSQARARRDFLGENFVTTQSDWFMRPEGEKEVTPHGDCYSWITRKISRK